MERTDETKQKTLIHAAFCALLDSTEDMVFVKDTDLKYIAASMPFVRMVGKTHVSDIIGKTDFEIFADPELAGRYIADDRRLMAEGRNLVDYMEPIADKDGQARYGSTSKYLLYDGHGLHIGILGITREITKEFIIRQNYQRELRYLFELPQDMYAVCYIDVDNWHLISQRRQRIMEGTLESCQTIERICETALEAIVDKKSDAAEFYRRFSAGYLNELYAAGGTGLYFEYRRRMSDGSIRWIHNEVKLLMDVESGHLCVMLSAKDISTPMQETQKLVEAAKMDRMTMLLNRETTMESIRQVLEKESGKRHVLFMLDMDNFKSLNDTRGHQAGDKFLITLTSEIKKCFRQDDIAGRIGGDEFFVLMKNVSDLSRAKKKAEELLLSIQRVCADYADICVSGSIGISVYPYNGTTLEALYAQADAALYQAKKRGKNQYVFAGV